MWARDPRPKTQRSPLAAASAGGEVWAGAVAGGSTSRSGHTAGTGLCSAAPVLSQLRSCQEKERGSRSASGEARWLFLASWPCGAPRYEVCPCLPSPGMAVFQRFGHFCSGAGRSCRLPSSCRGPARTQHMLEDDGAGQRSLRARSPGRAKYCTKMPKSRRWFFEEGGIKQTKTLIEQ